MDPLMARQVFESFGHDVNQMMRRLNQLTGQGDQEGDQIVGRPSYGLGAPFRLLDLPVECVLHVLHQVDSLRQRWILFDSVSQQLAHLIADPKSCCGPVELQIDLHSGAFGEGEDHRPLILLEYCEMPCRMKEDRDNVVQALRMANMCPEQLQAVVYVGQATRSLVAILLDYIKEHERSFVGSEVTVKLELNLKQQMPVPIYKVRQLLSALRARACSVTLVLHTVAQLKLPKKADRLSDVRQYLSVYPFRAVRLAQRNRFDHTTLLVNVPGCMDPMIPSAALVGSLRELDIAGKHFSSTVLNQVLIKFTQLRKLTCAVIYEADSSDAALDFHLNMDQLTVILVKQPGESTTPEECDYCRCLVNRCPNAGEMQLKTLGKFSPQFIQSLVSTFLSTRAIRYRQLQLGFTSLDNWVLAWVTRAIDTLMAQQPHLESDSQFSSDHDAVLTASDVGGADRLLSLLPPAVARTLDCLGARLDELRIRVVLEQLLTGLRLTTCLAGHKCLVMFI